jgi:hypothetical protein
MAKATKPKKVKEPPVSEPELVSDETVVNEIPMEADGLVPIPEKTEPVIETPIMEEKLVEPDKVVYTEPINDERSMEEKIVAFLDSREGSDIKLNDFLKSLFGVPKFNEPPNWLSQGASKQLRVLLGDMQTKGLISISNNMHTKLGTFYYDGNSPVTLYHSLNTVPLVAKK